MLKSTYRQAAPNEALPPLPPGWTEHKAPTGHPYYYHAESQTSTYTRPVAPSEEPLQIDYGATEPDQLVRASMHAMDEFHRNNPVEPAHFTGGRSYQDHTRRRGNQGDRPKSKIPILNCHPWVLVKTKLGRRFVHNQETKQSLWKFPQDVMLAVIEMERLEWEAKKKSETEREDHAEPEPKDKAEAVSVQQPSQDENYDSDSYEEVEVTDDEEDGFDESDNPSKRPRISEEANVTQPNGPVEFNEDDIEWQLAQMEGDYDDHDEVDNEDLSQNDENDEGLPLTAADTTALFRSLLDDSGISPYSVFEKVIEDLSIVEDERYVMLPNTSSRKEAFAQWSKDRIAEAQAAKELERRRLETSNSSLADKDPKIQYLRLLQLQASPKLYWPEFRRKYKKEPAMKDLNLQDKEREKLYREYISKLKLSESDRRKDLVSFLKGADIPKNISTLEEMPLNILKDLRYYLVDPRRRDDLVRTFLESSR
ncbi:hypothetical protein PV10_07725 [Exophiala mesophila]|uniref:WW domain-containing protein n=1 Tax=Exophiala mesophila TaxID=212818 RepID=A0A0D1XQN6_EXOME|nr:uncharacterized protein PV10_07725 [Exophiala mesophila]KIV90416.1 hypothetical protein PV10_07725 [Exophiala mesophila]